MTSSVRIAVMSALLAATAAVQAHGQQTYAANFGYANPIIAASSQIDVTYYGWEASTVYGQEIYAMTKGAYSADLGLGCFGFYAVDRASCKLGSADLGLLQGAALFNKPYVGDCTIAAGNCAPNPYLAAPLTHTPPLTWDVGTEIVFALMVNQGNGEYNWFFSGDPARNKNQDGSDGYAHLAYFPASTYPDGVPGNKGEGFVPQTAGLSLFGFEDVTYEHSDWDFDNAIFAISAESIGTPTQTVTPEPATLGLLATGLAGLGALTRPRRRAVRHA